MVRKLFVKMLSNVIALLLLTSCSSCIVTREQSLYDTLAEASYVEISSNTAYTSIQGVSNIVLQMTDAGYTLNNIKLSDEYYDILLKGEFSFRIIFEVKTHKLTCVSNSYAMSYIPMQYINLGSNY